MKTRNYAICFTMIVLLILMQFVSPFLHAHISDPTQTISSYEMHFHGDSDHGDDTTATNSVVHFEAIASYVTASKHIVTKNITFKKLEPVILAREAFRFMADNPPRFRPPNTSLHLSEPISVGFMALAPPVA